MPKHVLEEQLEALTREFVSRLVEAIRNASFADVASLSTGGVVGPSRTREPREPRSSRPPAASSAPRAQARVGADRQTAARRAEVGERILAALRGVKGPLGVRAIATELGMAPDLLAAPIRELRSAGKIRKHGEKRATTYSLA